MSDDQEIKVERIVDANKKVPSDQEAKELREFIDLAFEAHPNLDLDVAAIRATYLAKAKP